MNDFRRYQPRRSQTRWPWGRVLIGVAIIVVLVLVGRWVFGGRGSDNGANEPTIALINDQNGNTNTVSGNTNTPLNGNQNTNAEINANANTNVAVASDTATILSHCPGAVSQIGEQNSVALTFDIAAENDAANTLLDALIAQKTPVAFFASGTFATNHGSFLKKIVDSGYPVYNKGYSTQKFSNFSGMDATLQIQKADQAISTATRVSTKPFFRPPYGDIGGSTVTSARAAGYCTVLWTVDGYDWQDGQTVEGAMTRIKPKLKAGAIILLHMGYDITPQVVTSLLTELTTAQLTPVPLAELFR